MTIAFILATDAKLAIDNTLVSEVVQNVIYTTVNKSLIKFQQLPKATQNQLLNLFHLANNNTLVEQIKKNNHIQELEIYAQNISAEAEHYVKEVNIDILKNVKDVVEEVVNQLEEDVENEKITEEVAQEKIYELVPSEAFGLLIPLILYDVLFDYAVAKNKSALVSLFDKNGLIPVAKRRKHIAAPETLLPSVIVTAKEVENKRKALEALSPQERTEFVSKQIAQFTPEQKTMLAKQLQEQLLDSNFVKDDTPKEEVEQLIALLKA